MIRFAFAQARNLQRWFGRMAGFIVKSPRVVAAQRLQSWLLVIALVCIVLTGLIVLDLIRNLRSVVIDEAKRAVSGAATELLEAGQAWERRQRGVAVAWEQSDEELKLISYGVLKSYFDVEGGFLRNERVIGHSFPPYAEPGSALRQPPLEHDEVIAALAESRSTGRVAHRMAQDNKDIVIVAVLAQQDGSVAAWSLRRIFNFSDSSELNRRFLLVGVMAFALVAIGIVLRLSLSLQRGFGIVQSGLERMRTDLNYRVPDQEHELRPIVQAINAMAESREMLEAALRREDRLRVIGRVVAGIAHEIRNPLNSIRLTIRVLARRLRGQPEAAKQIELITGEVDRLDALLRGLLAFRPEERTKLIHQPLRPIVDRTLALIKPHASEGGVNVQVQGALDAEAEVDCDSLQQALMNLLLNAIDASGCGGEVRIILQPVSSSLEIRIEDTGPGLTPQQQERLFEPFYTTKPRGTGLGLAMSRTILDNMGAVIEYTSGASGACFRIILPVTRSA